MKLLDFFKPKKQTAKPKPMSLGKDEFISQIDRFFDDVLMADTDEILAKVGKTRQSLSALLYDDEIDEKITRRLENLKQSPFTLSPSEGMTAQFVYDELNLHLDDLVSAIMNAKLYGYSVSELVWHDDGRVKSITQKPMEWFEPKKDGRLFYHADNITAGVDISANPTYRQKVLLVRHEPTYKNPKGKALLSRVYWLHYYKVNGFAFWAKNLERFGSPLMIGKTADTDDLATTRLSGAMLEAQDNSVLAIGIDDDIQVINSSGNNVAFEVFDNAINRRIAKYLLGQTLTSGTDVGGTYGQGKVHQDQQEIIFNSDRKFVKKYIQQFIDVICEVNGHTPPVFNWIEQKSLQTERASRDLTLSQIGVAFTDDYFADMYDIDKKYIKSTPNIIANSPQAKGGVARQFTDEQMRLETLADGLTHQPLPTDDVLNIIKNAKDKDEMITALAKLVGDDDELIMASLAVADLYGVIDEAENESF
ncbi:DUF935 domain-containing protein [Moraxella bovis]|uniref:DUF935 domain-containing protein n=1 Tax=Moraxella bovis TaxID=476 RepID=UPI0022268ABF|nr:DUF935 domain-containing protein [Moraxella bovis]UZA25724.1 DUF935 domain-containing protein [Moraxella bovis]UZA28785.1 DUF935 domain-containing protein [Moraxella bovis]